jgi:hypothetical protein
MSESEKQGIKKENRKGYSAVGLIFRFLLVFVGMGFLYFNEYRVIKKKTAIREGTAIVVPAPAKQVLPGNQGNLIHVSGMLHTKDKLTDPDFGIQINAIHLKRNVEIFQWTETIEINNATEETANGKPDKSKKYAYHRLWKSGLTNYKSFHDTVGHINPVEMPLTSKWLIADEVYLGAYELSKTFVNRISYESPLYLAEYEVFDTLENATIYNNKIYMGNGTVENPNVGDIRIAYTIVEPQVISVIGKQNQGMIETYITSNRTKINLLEKGEVSAQSMFQGEIKSNTFIEWGTRVFCIILIFVGCMIVFKWLKAQLTDKGLASRLKRNGIIRFSLFSTGFLVFLVFGAAWLFLNKNLTYVFLALALISALMVFMTGKTVKPADNPTIEP